MRATKGRNNTFAAEIRPAPKLEKSNRSLNQFHKGLSALSYIHVPSPPIIPHNGSMNAARLGNIPLNQSHNGLSAISKIHFPTFATPPNKSSIASSGFVMSFTIQSTIALNAFLIGLNIENPAIISPTSFSSNPKNPAIFLITHLIASSSIIPRSRNAPKKFLIASENPSQIASQVLPFDSVNPVTKSNAAIMICTQKKSFPKTLPIEPASPPGPNNVLACLIRVSSGLGNGNLVSNKTPNFANNPGPPPENRALNFLIFSIMGARVLDLPKAFLMPVKKLPKAFLMPVKKLPIPPFVPVHIALKFGSLNGIFFENQALMLFIHLMKGESIGFIVLMSNKFLDGVAKKALTDLNHLPGPLFVNISSILVHAFNFVVLKNSLTFPNHFPVLLFFHRSSILVKTVVTLVVKKVFILPRNLPNLLSFIQFFVKLNRFFKSVPIFLNKVLAPVKASLNDPT